MKKPLTSLMALAFVGLLFFPDATRAVARTVAGTAGHLVADATATAFVAVDDRIAARKDGSEVLPATARTVSLETPRQRCCPH
ncbi:MAG: hypothetical protein HKO57_13455 [Akkermansiaceae bacterium]|nr:hypothetical protein [Akkermansiaceae bacterium]